jgi:hypothetical protein
MKAFVTRMKKPETQLPVRDKSRIREIFRESVCDDYQFQKAAA